MSSTSGGTAATVRSLLESPGSRLALNVGSGTPSWALFDQRGSLVALECGSRTTTDTTRYDG